MRIDQFLPQLSDGDAIGSHVLRIRDILRRSYDSEIYVDGADAPVRREALAVNDYTPAGDSVLIYHSSIGSPSARKIMKSGARIVIDYHNVTPMHYFTRYEPRIAALLYAGRAECAGFAARSILGIADSSYSAQELSGMGYGRCEVLPILIDFASYDIPPDRRLLKELASGKRGSDFLFVGRLSPNKRQEDLMKAFTVYKRAHDPDARLFLVGKTSSHRYRQVLSDFRDSLGVDGIHMIGPVPFGDLLAYYTHCDAFFSMSEHEGFGVPFVEAMKFGVPILAYGATAIPETVGDAGIVFTSKDYEEVAGLMHLVATDTELRERLIARGRRRLEHFDPERHESRLLKLIDEVA